MIKSISLNIKDISLTSREAVLAHATYKSLDKDEDMANRGMFDKSWKVSFNELRYFLNHDRKQAPGKVIRAWDDEDHAYTQVKHGTHTLGEDTLKMLDEGVIVAVSYGFIPLRQKKIPSKGMSYLEVKHMETSALTHWGAHDESHIVTVQKAFDDNKIQELQESISRMERFCRNTTASDQSIMAIQKEINRAKQLLIKNSDTASTSPSMHECPTCRTISVGVCDEAGNTKCAECSHILIKGSSQLVSSNKSDLLRRKLLLLKQKMN